MSNKPIDISPYVKGSNFRVSGPEPDYIIEDELTEGVERLSEALRGFSVSMEMVLTSFGRAAMTLLEAFSEQDQSNGMTLDELIPETIAEWKQIRGETDDQH